MENETAIIYIVVTVLVVWLVIRLFIWVIQQGVKEGIKSSTPAYNEPIVPLSKSELRQSSPRKSSKYSVSGVDRESKMETTLVVEATTKANAQAKAELEGVLVTEIEEV
jgi:hypothetical protein